MNPIKISKKIEEEAIDIWEKEGWTRTERYLEEKGFTRGEILEANEYWAEGKSFYPYQSSE